MGLSGLATAMAIDVIHLPVHRRVGIRVAGRNGWRIPVMPIQMVAASGVVHRVGERVVLRVIRVDGSAEAAEGVGVCQPKGSKPEHRHVVGQEAAVSTMHPVIHRPRVPAVGGVMAGAERAGVRAI